jgi:ubiquilin
VFDQVISSNPMLSQMMTPEMRSTMQGLFSNPQMLQSMLAMGGGGMGAMGGMGGMGGMGAMGGGMGPFGSPTGAAQNAADGSPMDRTANPAGGMPGFNPFMFMPQAPAATAQPTVPPEERFSSQLQQLSEMGFLEPEKNIRALLLTGGNVNAAIEWHVPYFLTLWHFVRHTDQTNLLRIGCLTTTLELQELIEKSRNLVAHTISNLL